jgi:hypothetical protein
MARTIDQAPYAPRIAAEASNVLTHPLESLDLIEKAIVCGRGMPGFGGKYR